MSSWFESRVSFGIRSVFTGKRLLSRLIFDKRSYMEGLTMDLRSSEASIRLPAEGDSITQDTKLLSKNDYVGALTIENREADEWATVEVLSGDEVLSMEKLLVLSRTDNIISVNICENSKDYGQISVRVRTGSESKP